MLSSRIVLLHGAVNTSNFGDVLFVKMFYESVIKRGDVPVFITKGPYRISDFNIGELSLDENDPAFHTSVNKADILIMISGGYFGDNTRGILSASRRWLRYFSIGLLFALRKKEILILGVGGAPLYNWFNRLSARIIMNRANKICVRDEDTAAYFEKIGVVKPIKITADTALAITAANLPALEDEMAVNCFINGRKAILLHLTGISKQDEDINRVIIPELIAFLKKEKDTCIFLTYDNQIKRKIEDTSVFSSLKEYDPYVYDYHSAMQLCSLLNRMDTIITTKLHVGIIGCSLGKSVLSFPMHKHKTKRFYDRIGYSERCRSFFELKEGSVISFLEHYHCLPISVPAEIRKAALENLSY